MRVDITMEICDNTLWQCSSFYLNNMLFCCFPPREIIGKNYRNAKNVPSEARAVQCSLVFARLIIGWIHVDDTK